MILQIALSELIHSQNLNHNMSYVLIARLSMLSPSQGHL